MVDLRRGRRFVGVRIARFTKSRTTLLPIVQSNYSYTLRKTDLFFYNRRGSLRFGFSPWSAEALDAQFEKIRVDESLMFSELGAEPPVVVDEKLVPEQNAEDVGLDKTDGEPELPEKGFGKKQVDTSRVVMPGRETVKRRLLKLLDGLVNPREPPAVKAPRKPKPRERPRETKQRPPTKKEQKDAARAAAAVARIADDAKRALEFKKSLTGGSGKTEKETRSKNEEASGVRKESPPGASQKNVLSSPSAKAEATPGKRAAAAACWETLPAKKAKTTPVKAKTTPAKATTPVKSPVIKASTPSQAKSPAAKAATPKAKSPASKAAASPAVKPAAPLSPLRPNAALSPVRRSPRGKVAPNAVAKPIVALTETDDPLATLVLPLRLKGGETFQTPSGVVFKKAGTKNFAAAAASTGKKQASLLGLGFFAKTPAAGASAAPSARTPTTGGF